MDDLPKIGDPLMVGLRNPAVLTDADLEDALRGIARQRQIALAKLPAKWRKEAAECGPYAIVANTYEQCACDIERALVGINDEDDV